MDYRISFEGNEVNYEEFCDLRKSLHNKLGLHFVMKCPSCPDSDFIVEGVDLSNKDNRKKLINLLEAQGLFLKDAPKFEETRRY